MSGATEHERLADLVPAVALGAATPDEIAAVERHAAGCHICRAELDAFAVTVGQIAAGVAQTPPPASLRGDVMAAIRAERSQRPAAARARRRGVGAVVAGVLASVVIVVAVWGVVVRDDRPTQVSLSPSTVVGDLRVNAIVSRVNGRRVAVVRVDGLGATAPDIGYEVWTVPASGPPESAGFMSMGPDRQYTATVDVSAGQTVAITREPRTNTVAPTGTPLVVLPTESAASQLGMVDRGANEAAARAGVTGGADVPQRRSL